MDYSGILKRAWNVTWKYKILWLFGFFAGAGSGGGFNSSSNRGSFPGTTTGGTTANPTAQWFADQGPRLVPVFIGAGILLFLLLIVWIALSVAAQGGLVHLVNEAEEGRAVKAGDGWRAGFKKWWRVLGIIFLVGLPILALVVGFLIVFFATLIPSASRASAGGQAAVGAAILTTITGMCLLTLLFVVAVVALGIILGVVRELAIRYAVLEDRGVIESLKQGWKDLWGRRGAFVMYLIQLGLGIAFGVVVFLLALLLIGPGVFLLGVRAYLVGALLVFVGVVVLAVIGSAYAAFYHAVWTIFFRRMTTPGLAPAAAGVPTTTLPGLGYPPPPPSGLGMPSVAEADPWVAANSLPGEGPATVAPAAPAPPWAMDAPAAPAPPWAMESPAPEPPAPVAPPAPPVAEPEAPPSDE